VSDDGAIESEEDIAAEAAAPQAKLALRDGELLRRFLQPLARPFHDKIAWLLACVGVDTLFNISFPIVERLTIDEGLLVRNWSVVFYVILFILSAAVAVTLIGLAMDVLSARICSGMTSRLRETMYAKLDQLPLSYFHRTEGGEILSRFSGDVIAVEDGLGAILPWLILPGLEVVYSIILMFSFNLRLALVGMLVFPLNMFAPRLFTRRSFTLGYEKRRREARLLTSVAEQLAAQPIVRAFSLAQSAQRRFAALAEGWRQTAFQFDLYSALVERATYTGVYVVHALVFAIGAYWAFSDVISLGTLVAFETMFLSMGDAISHVTESVPMLAEGVGGMRHLSAFLDEPASAQEAPDAVPIGPLAASLEFREVGFAHAGGRFKMAGLSLLIPAQTRTALVGRSGSGKSTLINLILRFEDPCEGTILLDGKDIRTATLASLRDGMGVVFQETFLFHTTIAENIAAGKKGATRAEIEAASKAAELHEFVLGLPQGYQTIVGERGSQMSGGQRQRIAIARALLRDPALLLLDEATSGLDPATEAALVETIERIAKTRTVVAASHRLSSIAGYDRIIVLDQGRLRESGTHTQLLRKAGLYATLWRRQRAGARRS
jgi:ATP-binding cassette subfamily B protein